MLGPRNHYGKRVDRFVIRLMNSGRYIAASTLIESKGRREGHLMLHFKPKIKSVALKYPLLDSLSIMDESTKFYIRKVISCSE